MSTSQLNCMIALLELLQKHKPGPAAAAEAFAGVAMAEMAAETDAAATAYPAATTTPAATAHPAATTTETTRQKTKTGAHPAATAHPTETAEFFSLTECQRQDYEANMMLAEDVPYLMFLANAFRGHSEWPSWFLRADTRSMLEELD